MTERHTEILRRQFANDPERLKEILEREAAHQPTPPASTERDITRLDWFMIGLLAPVLLLALLVIVGAHYLGMLFTRRS